jgi:hypothetical protein
MPTPYTTKTGIQIGIMYQHPKPQLSADEELIQSAFLKKRNPFPWRPTLLVVVLLVVGFSL